MKLDSSYLLLFLAILLVACRASDDEDDVFLLPYRQIHDGPLKGLPTVFYFLASSLVVGMFYMMYVMADRHLTWTLEHLAVFCRMSPDMAGMTFLAFGNGAPDFFTAVFGAQEAPLMTLSSSVGSGLFILTVVLGLVILLAKPKDTFSIVRKVDEVLTLPDGSIPELSAASKRILNQPKVSPTAYLRNGALYGVCIAFLALFVFKRKVPLWQSILLVCIYFVYMGASVGLHYYQEIQAKKAAKRLRKAVAVDDATPAETKNEQAQLEAFQELEDLPIYHRVPAAIIRVSWTFAERTGVVLLDVAILAIKLPVDLLFNVTVPPMESVEEAATCPPHLAALRLVHRVRMLVSPIGSLFMVWILVLSEDIRFTPLWWLTYCGAALLGCGLMFWTTSNREAPRLFPLHVTWAFASCILWIYTISKELVSCVEVTGELAGIPPSVLGTILAWGNSFGDLVANVAMAKNGHFETAMTAVFCGPVQNVLLTIGTSFALASFKEGTLAFKHVKPDIGLLLSLGTLMLVFLVLMIAVPVIGRFRVPRWLGWFLLGTYVVYLPISILGGLELLPL